MGLIGRVPTGCLPQTRVVSVENSRNAARVHMVEPPRSSRRIRRKRLRSSNVASSYVNGRARLDVTEGVSARSEVRDTRSPK